jgi:transcriptional regulator with XRE-family HTH domain
MSKPPSLAEKLRRLMASRQENSSSLASRLADIPGLGKPLSRQAVDKIAKGATPSPGVDSVVALARALGVPPAHLLPHETYDDLAALSAFEDSHARRIIELVADLPGGYKEELIAQIRARRDELGMPEPPTGQALPEPAPRSRRKRAPDEVAGRAADLME